MIKIIFCGIGGRIGQTMYKSLLKNKDFTLVAGVDKFARQEDFDIPVFSGFDKINVEADVIIDFSKPEAVDDLLPYALEKGLKVVIATTGHTDAQMWQIYLASKQTAVFMASNMSLGVNLLANLAKDATKFLGSDYDVEIIEQHHNQKVDAPSGTALTLANVIKDVRDTESEFVFGRHEKCQKRKPSEIGIHAIRGGAIVGKHDVMFIGSGEIITLAHEAMSKEVFVNGSLRAASFIMNKPSGMYDMNCIIGSLYAVTNVSVEENVTLITIPEIEQANFVDLLVKLANHNINLDMISQTLNENDMLSVSFTLNDTDNTIAYNQLYDLNKTYFAKEHTCKITSEGAGMEHQSGVAKDVLNVLTTAGASIFAITTSETKISCCINKESAEAASAALKKYYKI